MKKRFFIIFTLGVSVVAPAFAGSSSTGQLASDDVNRIAIHCAGVDSKAQQKGIGSEGELSDPSHKSLGTAKSLRVANTNKK